MKGGPPDPIVGMNNQSHFPPPNVNNMPMQHQQFPVVAYMPNGQPIMITNPAFVQPNNLQQMQMIPSVYTEQQRSPSLGHSSATQYLHVPTYNKYQVLAEGIGVRDEEQDSYMGESAPCAVVEGLAQVNQKANLKRSHEDDASERSSTSALIEKTQPKRTRTKQEDAVHQLPENDIFPYGFELKATNNEDKFPRDMEITKGLKLALKGHRFEFDCNKERSKVTLYLKTEEAKNQMDKITELCGFNVEVNERQ